MWGCFLKVLLQTKKTLTLLAVNLSTRSFFENRNVSYTPCNIPLPPPSHPSRSPNSYEISDWPTPIESRTKAIETLPEKKTRFRWMREFFNLQYIITFRTPLPCFNVVTTWQSTERISTLKWGRGRFGYGQKSLFCSNVSTLCLIVACYGDQGRVHTTTEEN